MPIDQALIIDMLSRVHLFRDADETKLRAITERMEEVSLPAGTTIFTMGDAPDYFYFIFDGRVRLLRRDLRSGEELVMGVLEKGDYFGHEVLETDWPRQVNAETTTDCILLRLSVSSFVELLDVLPNIDQRLQFILDSYRLFTRTHFSWIDSAEMIYFISRKHILFLFNNILPPVLFGILTIPLSLFFLLTMPATILAMIILIGSVFISILWFIWAYIDWTNDYYIVTNQRVIYQEQIILFYESRQESPLSAVQSTTISTSQVGRILRYGNVAVRTFIGTILFRSVPSPEEIMALIQQMQLRTQIGQTLTELSDIKKRLDKRITQGPQYPSLPKPPKPQVKPEPMRQFLSTMFHLRYETPGTLIYRTHWFILLQKIGLPSLILIGMALLFLVSASAQFPILSIQATCGLMFVAAVVVGVWWGYQYIDWHNDVYLITGDQVVDVNKKPLGREVRQAAPIKNILSIEYKRLGLIGLLLNYGTVYIRVGDQTLTFDDVFNPSEVQRDLFHKLQKKINDEKQAAAESDRKRIADWIAVYNEWSRQNQEPRTPPPPPVRGGF